MKDPNKNWRDSFNMHAISVHCRKIYSLFVRALETGRNATANKSCTYIVFIMQCQIVNTKTNKNKQQLRNFLKRWETSVVLIVFQWCFLSRSRLYCYRLLLFVLLESVTRKVIFWSVEVHVYNRHLSSQCISTAQIKREYRINENTWKLHQSKSTIFIYGVIRV